MTGISMPRGISEIDMNENYSELLTLEVNMSENISGTITLIQRHVLQFFFLSSNSI